MWVRVFPMDVRKGCVRCQLLKDMSALLVVAVVISLKYMQPSKPRAGVTSAIRVQRLGNMYRGNPLRGIAPKTVTKSRNPSIEADIPPRNAHHRFESYVPFNHDLL